MPERNEISHSERLTKPYITCHGVYPTDTGSAQCFKQDGHDDPCGPVASVAQPETTCGYTCGGVRPPCDLHEGHAAAHHWPEQDTTTNLAEAKADAEALGMHTCGVELGVCLRCKGDAVRGERARIVGIIEAHRASWADPGPCCDRCRGAIQFADDALAAIHGGGHADR